MRFNVPAVPGAYEAWSKAADTESTTPVETVTVTVFVTVGAVVPAGSVFWKVIVAVPSLIP